MYYLWSPPPSSSPDHGRMKIIYLCSISSISSAACVSHLPFSIDNTNKRVCGVWRLCTRGPRKSQGPGKAPRWFTFACEVQIPATILIIFCKFPQLYFNTHTHTHQMRMLEGIGRKRKRKEGTTRWAQRQQEVTTTRTRKEHDMGTLDVTLCVCGIEDKGWTLCWALSLSLSLWVLLATSVCWIDEIITDGWGRFTRTHIVMNTQPVQWIWLMTTLIRNK